MEDQKICDWLTITEDKKCPACNGQLRVGPKGGVALNLICDCGAIWCRSRGKEAGANQIDKILER